MIKADELILGGSMKRTEIKYGELQGPDDKAEDMAQLRVLPQHRFHFPENWPSQVWLESTRTPSTGKLESEHQKLRQGI